MNDFDPKKVGEIPEQLRKDSRAADKIDRERAEFFLAMTKSPGWGVYTELLASRIEALGTRVLDPAGSVDGAMLLEYEKGTMRGLLMARDLPSLIIEQMKQIPDPDTENSNEPPPRQVP